MRWMKVDEARKYAGGLSRQTIYAAVRQSNLRVAFIGAGRNWVTCEKWLDEWLCQSAESQRPDQAVRS